MPTLAEYIESIRNALRHQGARLTYFPMNKSDRVTQNLKLAREIGYGLKDYSPSEVKDMIGSLYSIIIVSNSLDSVGVAVSAKEWIDGLLSPPTR